MKFSFMIIILFCTYIELRERHKSSLDMPRPSSTTTSKPTSINTMSIVIIPLIGILLCIIVFLLFN